MISFLVIMETLLYFEAIIIVVIVVVEIAITVIIMCGALRWELVHVPDVTGNFVALSL